MPTPSARGARRRASGGQAPEDFLVELVALTAIRPYERNPRQNAPAVQAVVQSIRQFGFRQPIVVDAEGVIVAGHTRFLAAQHLGLEQVPVHRASALTPAQVRAYRLADNRTAELGEWDLELLVGELAALQSEDFDIAGLGWSAGELGELLAPADNLSAERADTAAVAPPPEKPVTVPGERIELGRHVLLCADARQPASWEALLGTQRVAALWTDPPYGVAVQGGTPKKLTIQNDAPDVEALTALLRAALGLGRRYTLPGGAWWVCGPHGPTFLAFAQVLTELGVWRQTLVWAKDRFVLGRQDFHWQHEVLLTGLVPPDADAAQFDAEEATEFQPLAYGWQPDGAHRWFGDRRASTVLKFPRPAASREHPTMKPVALVEHGLRLTVPPGGVVVDPFLGSGSTLLAAEACGRTCRGLELDPAYCDVVVARWEALTGIPAKRSPPAA